MRAGVRPPESASENDPRSSTPVRTRSQMNSAARARRGVAVGTDFTCAAGHDVAVEPANRRRRPPPRVEPRGIEPLTFWLPAKCSPS